MAMQILEEGPKNLVVKFVGAATDTVDVSALNPPCDELTILEIIYDMPADAAPSVISWDATVDVVALSLNGHAQTHCFKFFGGLQNDAGAGKTGDVEVVNADVDGFIVIHFSKVHPQIAN